MSDSHPSVEKALRHLQCVVRRPATSGELPVRSFRAPERLGLSRRTTIGLDREQLLAFTELEQLLSSDLHFEHLEKPEESVREFVARVEIERGDDHVAAFISEHSRPLMHVTCYLAVEYLVVTEPVEIQGVQLLPMTDARIPELPRLSWKGPIGCVAAVSATGTSYRRMVDRSKRVGDYTLRSLRFALRHKRIVEPARLRFQVGVAFAFDDERDGWMVQPAVTRPLTLSQARVDSVLGSEVWSLVNSQSGTVAMKADLALQWLERARFSGGTPLVSLLFLFFALEALLGDRSSGLKAGKIAFRQMMLSHAVTGEFNDPDRTWWLYDDVRSNAVHGEHSEIDSEILQRFELSVFATLECYLAYARENRILRRGKLMKALDDHDDRAHAERWLRDNADPEWLKFLAG